MANDLHLVHSNSGDSGYITGTPSSAIYESSELSVSSSASNRVKSYLKQHNIPESHIDKHFTFKSCSKSEKLRRKHKKHHVSIPSGSHSIIRFSKMGKNPTSSIDSDREDDDTTDLESDTSSTSDDDKLSKAARLTKHDWWTRLTIQCACCGVMIIDFGWSIVECLIIPYLFLSNTPYFCISWILFFIPLIDSWLQPSLYISFHKFVYKHHNYYIAQLALIIFALFFLLGFFILPHSNIFDMSYIAHHKHTWHTLNLDRIFIAIVGFTIMNLSLGYLLIPLRFIMNDAMAKISSKQWFSLRKQTIDNIYNSTNLQYLSSKAEKNYMSSFDALATQIYNINEYNHYLHYSQRSIAIWQIIGRCAGYLFASIDWLSFKFIENDWMYAHKYGHIDLCFSFTCGMTIFGLFLVTAFTIYVHAYAMKKIKKKKKKFYRFKSLLLNDPKQRNLKFKLYKKIPMSKMAKSASVSMSYNPFNTNISPSFQPKPVLDYFVPTLQSKIKFDLTRICNINPRTRCCYFLIDGIELHEESVQIYMDCYLNKKLHPKHRHNDDAFSFKSNNSKQFKNGWNMISINKQNANETTMSLFAGLSAADDEALSIPFELCLFWWMCFFGWLCVISFLHFFTIFVAQALSPCSLQKLPDIEDAHTNVLKTEQQQAFMDSIRYACLIMMFNAIGAGLIQLFIIERVLSINHCKTLLIGSEIGISLTCILFFFTHDEYHPSFVILLVTCLGFLTQLHYNLPYLLIEYKMIAIRHKETRRQYRILSYYCSLIDCHGIDGIAANIDMTPFDSFKNSNKLMKIEQLKQHILQRYNLAFFFALFAVSVFTGLFVIPSMSSKPTTDKCMREMSYMPYEEPISRYKEPFKYKDDLHHHHHDSMTTAANMSSTEAHANVAHNPHFVFCIVCWGWLSLTADIVLLCIYVIYRQWWKPRKRKKKLKKRQQQKEFDEWKMKRAENTANNTSYYTYVGAMKEKGIKSFIRDKSKTIYQNLNILRHFNKNTPIQRASACTLKLFELKKDLRNKYKYRFNNYNDEQAAQHVHSSESTESESYLEYSEHSPKHKRQRARSPLHSPILYPLPQMQQNDQYLYDDDDDEQHVALDMMDDTDDEDAKEQSKKNDDDATTLIHEITKYNNRRHCNIKVAYGYNRRHHQKTTLTLAQKHQQHSRQLANNALMSQRNAQYGTFLKNVE